MTHDDNDDDDDDDLRAVQTWDTATEMLCNITWVFAVYSLQRLYVGYWNMLHIYTYTRETECKSNFSKNVQKQT